MWRIQRVCLILLVLCAALPGCVHQTPPTLPPTTTLIPTVTPLPAPPPTAEVVPDALTFQSTHTGFNATGAYHIMGEVINQSVYPLQHVKVTGQLFDISGAVITEGYDEIDVLILMPGQAAPFNVLLYDTRLIDASDYVLWAAGDGVDFATSTQVVNPVEVMGLPQAEPDGALRFDGVVTNDSPHLLSRVTVAITLFDARNRVVGVGTVSVPGPLNVGAIATFTRTFRPAELAGEVFSYRLLAEGRRAQD